jgi:hypothetical protein
MNARGATVMGALAATALGAAYLTWQRPKESKSDNAVKVLEASKTSLEKVHYEDGTRFTDLTRKVDDEAPVVWLRQGFLEGKAPIFDAGTPGPASDAGTSADGGALADAGTKPAVAVVPPPVPPTRELRGNERSDKAWEKFAPFEAVRALGVLADAKLKELALDQSPKLLELTVAGTGHRFRVSNPGPGAGFIGQYVMDEKSKEVYLLSGGALAEIEPSSTTLVDRRLHAFKGVDFDSFVVTLPEGGQKKEFVQTDAQIPQTTKIAPKEHPDKPDEFAKNWHDKIWNRMIVTEVLGKDEKPSGGDPVVLLRVDYFMKGKPKGWLELARAPTNAVQVFGKSENTAGWVALHAGVEEMALEAKKVVTGQ